MSSEKLNMNGQVFGTSKYMSPIGDAKLIGELEFEDFAPAECVCCNACTPEKARKRTYARVYENRLEYSWPSYPFLCLTKERCIVDNARIFYFDKAPTRASMYCGFIPCICCGSPMIYNKVPKCLCGFVDLRPCCGEMLKVAPSECFGLRCCLCAGGPCYECCSYPLFTGAKNTEVFLGKWKAAAKAYEEKHGLPADQMANFKKVVDGPFGCDTIEEVELADITALMTPQKQLMDDRGDDKKQEAPLMLAETGESSA